MTEKDKVSKLFNQKTIKKTFEFSGVGVHAGREANVKVHPAAENHGIVFVRTDSHPGLKIPATWDNIRSSLQATTIGINGTRISTVEHLLAALSAMGVDNALIEVDGPEVPIMDGSAEPIVDKILETGLDEQSASRKWLRIKKPIRVEQNGSRGEIRPSTLPRVFCSIEYTHPAIGNQSRRAKVTPEEFETEIAAARTYGFLQDIERLKALGLAKGGSLENAVVIGDDGPVNEGGFRFRDECVRHKILDLVGDLSLAGYRILGEVRAHRSGHSFNHRLVREMMLNPDCLEIVEEFPLAPAREDRRHHEPPRPVVQAD